MSDKLWLVGAAAWAVLFVHTCKWAAREIRKMRKHTYVYARPSTRFRIVRPTDLDRQRQAAADVDHEEEAA